MKTKNKRKFSPVNIPKKNRDGIFKITRSKDSLTKSASHSKSETASMWRKLEAVKVSDPNLCIDAFVRIVRELENGSYAIQEGEKDMGKYFVIHEPDRKGSIFVHIVPKEAYAVFKEMQREMPDSFLGFSILCGKIGKKEVRASCFAIPTNEITRAMIRRR
jgi:hypothetical protein